jgi:predicted metal-dependent phosphotriesterase family hydrolase
MIAYPTIWGLNIIVATGLYVYEELPQQYAYRGPGLLIDMPEPMVTDFSRDITEGIAGTEHITDDVLPALLASGVTQEQIEEMMVENPVRYFTPAKDGAA